jgi:hypothetical protein
MKAAGWVQTGLGFVAGLAAMALWRTHADEVRHSEEARVATAVANAGLERFGQRIPPPTLTPVPPQAAPPAPKRP